MLSKDTQECFSLTFSHNEVSSKPFLEPLQRGWRSLLLPQRTGFIVVNKPAKSKTFCCLTKSYYFFVSKMWFGGFLSLGFGLVFVFFFYFLNSIGSQVKFHRNLCWTQCCSTYSMASIQKWLINLELFSLKDRQATERVPLAEPLQY